MEELTHTVKPLAPGAQCGPYVIVRQVPGGVGGMAVVYQTRLTDGGPTIALKVAHVGLGGFLKDEMTFLKALNLGHPHIIKILPTPLGGGDSDYIVKDPNTGCWYFAMEYMAGGSLEDWLQRRKRLPLGQAIELVHQIGSALDEAHRAGVVHLDVKPSNILFRQNPEKGSFRATLTDFGISRPQGRVGSGQTTMTVEYASPEQARLAQGEPIEVGPSSDLYSLAVILYEMISGHLPFQADNELAMMHQIVYEAPPMPAPLLTPQLAAILQRALSKDPAARYPSAQALVAELEKLPPEAHRIPKHTWLSRSMVTTALAVLVGFGLGVPTGCFLVSPQTNTDTPQSEPIIRVETRIVTTTPQPQPMATNTKMPVATATLVQEEPTRRPTSTPLPPTKTPTPRPLPTVTAIPTETGDQQ